MNRYIFSIFNVYILKTMALFYPVLYYYSYAVGNSNTTKNLF